MSSAAAIGDLAQDRVGVQARRDQTVEPGQGVQAPDPGGEARIEASVLDGDRGQVGEGSEDLDLVHREVVRCTRHQGQDADEPLLGEERHARVGHEALPPEPGGIERPVVPGDVFEDERHARERHASGQPFAKRQLVPDLRLGGWVHADLSANAQPLALGDEDPRGGIGQELGGRRGHDLEDAGQLQGGG